MTGSSNSPPPLERFQFSSHASEPPSIPFSQTSSQQSHTPPLPSSTTSHSTSQNADMMLLNAQSPTPISVHGDHLCPTSSISPKNVSTAAVPTIAVKDVMASFVAERPRTACRVQSLAEASTSRDGSNLPTTAESSSAAVLRQKLAELSLHQQDKNDVLPHSQAASASQKIPHSPRAVPTSSSSMTQSAPSLEPNHGESKSATSLYKISRGRSDHVSPSRRWDRRGASASVLSGNSGSGSGGEESEITVRPGSSRRHPRSVEHLPGQNQTIATLTSRRPSANMSHIVSPTGTSHSPLSRKSSFRRHHSALARWVDNKPPSVAFEQNAQQDLAADDEDALRTDSLGHVTSSDEEGADAGKFARRRRVSLERDRRRGMRMLLASGGIEEANRTFTVSQNGRTSSVDNRGSSSPQRGRNCSSERRTRSEETGDLRLTPTSEGPSTCASLSTSTSATPTTLGDDYSERSSLLSRSSSSEAIECSAPAGLTPHLPPRRARMVSAGENAEVSVFGLEDDEQTEGTRAVAQTDFAIDAEDIDDIQALDAMPTSGALSSCALAAALSKRASRNKVRGQSNVASTTKIRSMPASRRPSHPETSIPGASSSSVPHRTSVILGFAPSAASTTSSSSSSTSTSRSNHNTIPRRRTPINRLALNRSLMLSVSPTGNRQEDLASLHIDLLSGSSVGSVEDFITVDRVEWASDGEDHARNGNRNTADHDTYTQNSALNSRRSSMISVRQGEADTVSCSGPPTVAALEAGSLLNRAAVRAGGLAPTDPQSSPTIGQPPLSPTASKGPIFSKEFSQPAATRQGFAAVYQDRISNLQSQLRLWSRDREHNGASSESGGVSRSSECENVNESAQPTEASTGSQSPPTDVISNSPSSGLLASSWKQIARLPNLFFHAGGNSISPPNKTVHASETADRSAVDEQVEPYSAVQDGSLTRSTSHDGDVSSLTDNQRAQISPLSSPNSSDFDLRHISDGDANLNATRKGQRSSPRISHGRSPSLGSRGVISPQDGDVDPGAYVTGLGHRIDPDVELATVVHMHAIRNHRGRSVDASRKSQGSHHQHRTRLNVPAAAHRNVASDSESMSAKHDNDASLSRLSGGKEKVHQASAITPFTLPETKDTCHSSDLDKGTPLANDEASRASHKSGGRSVSRRPKLRARFTIRDDEDAEAEDEGRSDETRLQEPVSHNKDNQPDHQPIAVAVEKQEGGPDSDGFTLVRGHRARGRPGVSRPPAEAPVPINFSAYGEMSSSASDDDSSSHNFRMRNNSRGREKGSDQGVPASIDMSRTSSGSRSADKDENRKGSSSDDLLHDSQREENNGSDRADRDAPGRGRRGRGRDRGSRNSSPQATPRNRQCAVGLFSGSSKQGRREGSAVNKDASAKIASVTCSNLGVRTVRSSPDLTYASVAATRTDRRGTSNSGRANGGPRSRPVSDDSSDDERSRRGRARGVTKVTSSSFKESECPRNSLPRSASAGDFKSLSFSPSSPQAVAAQAQALQMRQRQQAGSSNSMLQGPSSTGQASGAQDGSSAGLLPGNGSSTTHGNGSNSTGGLLTLPNRPSLLSNSAHLLMLSLELEMMRAQKISAPLRIRWARQRTVIAPSLILGCTATSEPTSPPAVQTDPDVCATSGSEATAVCPDATSTSPPICMSESEEAYRDPIKGNPLYSSLINARQLYGRAYRPRRGSQLRNVVDAQ